MLLWEMGKSRCKLSSFPERSPHIVIVGPDGAVDRLHTQIGDVSFAQSKLGEILACLDIDVAPVVEDQWLLDDAEIRGFHHGREVGADGG